MEINTLINYTIKVKRRTNEELDRCDLCMFDNRYCKDFKPCECHAEQRIDATDVFFVKECEEVKETRDELLEKINKIEKNQKFDFDFVHQRYRDGYKEGKEYVIKLIKKTIKEID